jgi:hypothetical protein
MLEGGSSGGLGGSTVRRVAKPSVGASIGKAVAKTVKKSAGSSVGRSVSRVTTSRSSGGGSSSSGGGGFSSGGGGGGGGGGGRGPIGGIPSLSAYLGTDSAYQNAIRGGKRSLTDFLSEIARRRGEAGTQFNQTTASMERDRVQQLEDLKNEFASRGLIQSGLYGEEQGKFQQKFTEQQTALQQQQAALLADLLGQEKNYRRENDLATEQAKQEALLRRAQKFNIGA